MKKPRKIHDVVFRGLCLLAYQGDAKRQNGRTEEEIRQVITWLTGYTDDRIDKSISDGTTSGDFFQNAPEMNWRRAEIHGNICGAKLDEITDLLMRDIRVLDKLIDNLTDDR